jgi:hypothetical protein
MPRTSPRSRSKRPGARGTAIGAAHVAAADPSPEERARAGADLDWLSALLVDLPVRAAGLRYFERRAV